MLLRLGGGKGGKLQKFWAASASFKPISCKGIAEVSKHIVCISLYFYGEPFNVVLNDQ